MADNWLTIVLLASLAIFIRGDESTEPRVAFLCGRPAMHSTMRGQSWVKDDSTDCLNDPVEILNYCKKVYPTLDIRNIVESSEQVTISDWCDYGTTVCDKRFTVSPFRCLVGAFQSDALLVPEHCVFDHIHDSKRCTTYQDWSEESKKACEARGLVQQSFAMLQPCKTDRFSGVEFVCCPTKQEIKDRSIVVISGSQQQQQHEAVKPDLLDKEAGRNEEPNKSDSSEEESSYGRYIQRQAERGNKWNERESFLRAKDDMRKHHHDKIERMMNDWAAARQRVQELRKSDPKGSEKLNKEITSRFERMYEAEEIERDSERKQLNELHEQRVRAAILENKEQAFDEYVNAISEKNSDAIKIMKSLRRYIKTLHKDRMHTINHYEHIEDTDPELSDSIHGETAEHLRRVDQQLTDALNMLSRVPPLRNKILKQLQEFIDAYHSMDKDVTLILLTQPAHKDEAKNKELKKASSDEKKSNSNDDDEDDKDDDENDEADDDEDDDSFDDEDSEDERTDEDVKKPIKDTGSTRLPVPVPSAVSDDHGASLSSSEEVEMEVAYHNLPAVERHADAANVNNDAFAVNEVAYKKSSPLHYSAVGSGVSLAIAVGTLTIIVVIVVGVLIMRRRRRHQYSRPLRLNLDPIGDEACSPEERHVASMQMNGYENPTYKFFEQQGVSA